MLCPFCREEVMEGASKCKHCSSMLSSGNEQTNSLSDLDVSQEEGSIDDLPEKMQKIFEIFEGQTYKVVLGIPIFTSIRNQWAVFCFIAVYCNFIGYLVCGLWKKGLSFLGLFATVRLLVAFGLPMPFLVFVAFCSPLYMGMTQNYDLYRRLKLKQDFWW